MLIELLSDYCKFHYLFHIIFLINKQNIFTFLSKWIIITIYTKSIKMLLRITYLLSMGRLDERLFSDCGNKQT